MPGKRKYPVGCTHAQNLPEGDAVLKMGRPQNPGFGLMGASGTWILNFSGSQHPKILYDHSMNICVIFGILCFETSASCVYYW